MSIIAEFPSQISANQIEESSSTLKSTKWRLALFQRNNIQNVFSLAQYSDSTEKSKDTINRAMRAYLERVVHYENFMKEQLQEYNKGKEFLASMMGRKSKEMTQKDIDDAIDYLFPSALFVPKSRPLLKPPEEIYEKQKKAAFDYSGRPFHFLFYTSKPNFSQCLHNAASKLQELNSQLYKGRVSSKPIALVGGRWISHKELEDKLQEGLYSSEYEKFMEVFKKLAEHPLSSLAENLIKQFWVYEKVLFDMKLPKVTVTEDGTEVVEVKRARKKTSIADVKVSKPGSGKIRINDLGIDYFYDMQCRQQVIYPLLLTEMLGKVDIEATVKGTGESSQASAIRLGISKALQGLVPKKLALEMKLSGLLQPDFRRRERKKPGRDGARRRYTWLKR